MTIIFFKAKLVKYFCIVNKKKKIHYPCNLSKTDKKIFRRGGGFEAILECKGGPGLKKVENH